MRVRPVRISLTALWVGCACFLVSGFVEPSQAEAPKPVEIASLVVEPDVILLRGDNRQQQVVVTARDGAGVPFDVTHACELTIRDSAVAATVKGRVTGLADGTTELRIRVAGAEATIPVRVSGFAEYPAVHFGGDVVPLFSKLGCNSAACHGKASGQNGFRLSVFGFDPAEDYNALLKEGRGRRVFAFSPEQSLLLLKGTGQVPHGGGKRIDVGSADYRLLLEWLKQGAALGRDDAPYVVALRVSPAERVLGMESEQQLLATAVFSDGRLRDVTELASYTSNASLVADVDRLGRVHTGKVPGEAAVSVHYMGHVAASLLQIPRLRGTEPYPSLPVSNRIDELVWAKLQKMEIVPAGPIDDATFLRRAFLDVIGTLPTPAEVRAFLADPRTEKRQELVEQLLEREEYADYWALQWSDILLVNRDKIGDRGAYEFHRWLRAQFARNRPYNEWVRELITASGSSSTNGPVNFYRASKTPEDATRAVSQAFLGIRLECAQCHHHPFEKWSQDDFYGLAGFFQGLERRPVRGEEELVIFAGYRETRHPVSNKPVPTHVPDGPAREEFRTGDPRIALADWVTDSKNAWFSRLVANRLWKHYLGRGLVEPEDDLRSTNPPTNGPLLDFLARHLAENAFDLKGLTRLIVNSQVYQRSSVPNATNRDDEQNFSHHRVKRLPAEVLLDAVSAVTESPELFPGRPHGARAIELWDNRLPSYFLDAFGRSERNSPCACGKSSEPTMAQALHLMNAPELERKVGDANGRVARLIKEQRNESQIVDELCLAALGRPPAERERHVARTLFAQESPRDATHDFLWVLLNSYEFLFVE